MATERPMRMVEIKEASMWLSSKDVSGLGPSFKSMATEELGFFLKGQKFSQGKVDFIPCRSGSAPPCMEGSVEAVRNTLAVRESSLRSNSDSLGNALVNRKSKGQCLFERFDEYCSSVAHLNPRLPPQHLRSQASSQKEDVGMLSSDNGSMVSLSNHNLEHENQGLLEEASKNLFEDSRLFKPGQDTALLSSRCKSLLDLIQEDFPRTPSPVYNQSQLPSLATPEDSIDLDVHAVPSSVSSLSISSLSDSAANSSSVLEKGSLDLNSRGLIQNDEVASETFPNSQLSGRTKIPLEVSKCGKDGGLKGDMSINELMHTEKQNLRESNAEARRHRHKHEEQYYAGNKLNQSFAHGYANQIPYAGAQVIPQGMNNPQSYISNQGHNPASFSSLEIQPSISSSGLAGSLYTSPAAFMTPGDPFYSNNQPSDLVVPQYTLDGYVLSSSIFPPPYMLGYPSQEALSFPYEIAYGPNLSGQAPIVSPGERVPPVGDFQNQNMFYGQLPYVDPYMQYYPCSSDDIYPATLQQNQLPSRKLTGDQFSSQLSQTNSAAIASLDDKKYHSQLNGGLTIPSVKNMGIAENSYFGNSSSMGAVMQFPALSLGSPILPSSPLSRTNPLDGQHEMKIPLTSRAGQGFCSRQRRHRNFGHPKKQSIIEELISVGSGKFELSDIAGRIVEFSIDQHGSRFIQQKLENCFAEERASVFEEILPHVSKLMTDVFGNYVIQKFFKLGSPDQRKKLAEQLSGHMLCLSLQMYGCRVIQKVLEVVEVDQKTQLVQELDGHVMRCVHDRNGNHVIQKCIECIPVEKIQFIISAFRGQVPTLSTHPYGCRVIQRVLEHCSDKQNIQCIVDEILESACVLIEDQYGNYVIQLVLEMGTPDERSQVISKLTGKIVQLSQHKYASNVIEKCWDQSNDTERDAFIEEIIRCPGESGNLLTMMKDKFGNYVVQKIIETSNHKQREILLSHIRVHLHALKKYTYGKHIVARFEQVAGPGNDAEGV